MINATAQAALRKMVDTAANPEIVFRSSLEQGRQVVLMAPEYTPFELVYALGLVPMGAWGADIELDKARSYFPSYICSLVQSAVELGLRGAYQGASAIIVPYLCDSLKVMGENWKYAVPDIAMVPLPLPQNRNTEHGRKFARASYQRVVDDLCRITGASYSDEALDRAIQLYNRHNAAMRSFAQAVAALPGTLSAAERSAVFKSAFFTDVVEHTAQVEALTSALSEGSETGKLRIITSGILADHPALLAILDECGFAVVADDVAAESRQYLTDAPEDEGGLDALASQFAKRGNCSLLFDPDKERMQRIVNLAQSEEADGVLVVLTTFCDPEEFDLPFLTRANEAAGIPQVVVNLDRQSSRLSQVRTALMAFKELLEDRRQAAARQLNELSG
jgi:benzoyl-CoA reductase/2-hydroxyglutaryl-CoA dehydratase subunit BcrC/BadD/HgdB